LFGKHSSIENEFLYRVIGAHEAGHVVMFSRFGVVAEASPTFDFEGEIVGGVTEAKSWTKPLTDFQTSAVGWGGFLAEYLRGFVLARLEGVPALSERTIGEWARFMRDAWVWKNETDRKWIDSHADIERTARSALTALASPYGSSLLHKESERLICAFRQAHVQVMAAKRASIFQPHEAASKTAESLAAPA
jgi:hypothetical protein